jgi:hypothetical protein
MHFCLYIFLKRSCWFISIGNSYYSHLLILTTLLTVSVVKLKSNCGYNRGKENHSKWNLFEILMHIIANINRKLDIILIVYNLQKQ